MAQPLPLNGWRVVVTRARAQADDLSERLRARGAEPIEVPAIRIAPPADDYAALDAAIARLDRYDWVVLTSVNGVDHFWRRLAVAGARLPPRARVAAIGRATAGALQERGVRVDVVPDRFIAESLLEALRDEGVAGQRFLLPRADIAREALHRGLVEAGALVDEPHAYRTVVGEPDDAALAALGTGVDALTFTSSSTVRNFVEQLGAERVARLAETAVVATIGPITARTAREEGLRVDVVATEHTIPGLVAALVEHAQRRVLR